MHTARLPVSWACALAANAPASSWRTPIHSSWSSRRIASVTGFNASPTTPQTVLTPSPGSASTISSATSGTGASSGSEAVGVGALPVGCPGLARAVQELTGLEPLVELGVALRAVLVDAAHEHPRLHVYGLAHAQRAHQLHRLVHRAVLVLPGALGLVGHVQRSRSLGILGGHADRALVRVTALRHDAAHGHHHCPGRVGVVGALGQALDEVTAGSDLAARAELHAVAQAAADERVVH